MVKQIIKEAMDQNPLGLKEAVEAELRNRVTLALESLMEEPDKLDEDYWVLYIDGKKWKSYRTDAFAKADAKEARRSGKEAKIVKVKGDFKESVDLEEAKMTDAEVLSAAKSLAANGKDPKTKAFGKGLVDFYKKEGSFTPAQVGGLQNIMKNASFQMAKESVELYEGVVGAGPAFFDDGSHTTISDQDAAAINRMFASKSSEEQMAARKKMKASRSYYNSVLTKARKG
jgi:hypothetical protein